MEFNNAFRHGVYCRALQRFLCMPEGGGFSRVDFVRVPVDLKSGDWHIWRAKGIRYWHLNAYYLPLCWVGTADFAKISTAEAYPASVRREDLVDWMEDGLRRGATALGFGDGPGTSPRRDAGRSFVSTVAGIPSPSPCPTENDLKSTGELSPVQQPSKRQRQFNTEALLGSESCI